MASAWQRFRADLRRYLPKGQPATARSVARAFWNSEALWAIAAFRAGQYLIEEAPPMVERALKPAWSVTHRFVGLALGIHLSPHSRIGAGLYIGHSGGVWISPRAEIGEHCNINHETTIGTAGDRGAPRLGNRVWVGPNATITGEVTIGDEAVVAANSLVVADVPPAGVVVGVPARLVSTGGSSKLLDPVFASFPRRREAANAS